MPFNADPAPVPARARAFLDFWFGPPGDLQRFHHKQIWFRSTPEFDAAVHAGFAADHDQAVAGAFADWEDAPLSALAHVMLLDQVPRNIFRSTPRAFASDALALAATNCALERGFDQAVPAAWRLFFYRRWSTARRSPTSSGVSTFSSRCRRCPAVKATGT